MQDVYGVYCYNRPLNTDGKCAQRVYSNNRWVLGDR